MNDDQKLTFAQHILDQHFGFPRYDETGKRLDGAECATCRRWNSEKWVGVDFPCYPALLARDVKDEVLGR